MTACLILAGAPVEQSACAEDTPTALSTPLSLADVIRAARANRPEIAAARARANALAQRPAIVSALEDPMISPSIDHYPSGMMEGEENTRRYDWSIGIEQRFPLSRVRGHRRAAARADAQRAMAQADSTELDVVLEAQSNFLMLHERRRMSRVLDEQISLAQQLVSVSSNRYANGTGMQADVLRAEVEVARVQAAQQSLAAQIRAAEAMLNTSLGRSARETVPGLEHVTNRQEPPSVSSVVNRALLKRPELVAGEAEINRTAAEIQIMRSMYKPMAMVRVGRASTMAEGPGVMAMIGISVPIWRNRLRAGVAEAQAMQRMADADLQAMLKMVEGEAAAARETVSAARAQVLMLENEVMPRARAATEAALAGYSSGQGTLVSVIESTRALWEVQTEQVMADTAIDLAWARLQRSIAAPRSGIVLNRGVSAGTAIDPSTEIVTLADLSQVWVIAEVAESDAAQVRTATAATLSFPASGREPFAAQVQFIYPTLTERTRTVRVRLAVANKDGTLRPGMYGSAEFPPVAREALTVPRDAVVDTGESQHVFVHTSDDTVEPRTVKVGARFADRVEILEGLKPGDHVLTTGVFLIDSESRLRASGGTGHSGHGSGQQTDPKRDDRKTPPTEVPPPHVH